MAPAIDSFIHTAKISHTRRPRACTLRSLAHAKYAGGDSCEPMSRCLPRDDPNPLYDPFRRHDQYGTMGVAPQPWWEILRLAILAVTLLPVKAAGVFGETSHPPPSLSSPLANLYTLKSSLPSTGTSSWYLWPACVLRSVGRINPSCRCS